jgi:Adenylate and Guanylate cyclase catalytic domain/SAM domain (Sterile alpha motif)
LAAELGLAQYEAVFDENAINEAILPKLTAEDLKDIGVTAVGHPRVLLDAIAALRGESPPSTRMRPSAAPEPANKPNRIGGGLPEAERRQLTVMFCDLVGSTALSAQLDPEDLRAIISVYHRCCAELVQRNGGFVAKYMGDGVLAYFGYPQAHDAERAVRAGLNLVEAVPMLNTAAGFPLPVRVGIATSLAVVGDLITEAYIAKMVIEVAHRESRRSVLKHAIRWQNAPVFIESSAARQLTISRHTPHGFLERVVCCEVDDASSAKGATNLPD